MSENIDESKRSQQNHRLLTFAYQNETMYIKRYLEEEQELDIMDIADKRDYNCFYFVFL